MSQPAVDGAAVGAAAPTGRVSSYKQLQQELDATQKRLRSLIAHSEKAKIAHAQVLTDAADEMRRQHQAELARLQSERQERDRIESAAREKQRADDADRMARENEIQLQKHVNEVVARTTLQHEAKFNELRSELMLAQRTNEELSEQHAALQAWQKAAIAQEASWQESRKSMQAAIENGRVTAENLQRYKTLLKCLTIHKYAKDVKLKQRLLQLHSGCTNIVATILKDEQLRTRLVHQQAELARWVNDAQAIERSEGIVSSLPSPAGGVGSGTAKGTAAATASKRPFLMVTNVDALLSSLTEVEHVLATCVSTVLRYNQHYQSTSDGFFERNSALTAYCMAVEKECRDTKAQSTRTQSQLHATLKLLSRLEVKYSQVSRKLGKEDRIHAQRYLQRHGITSTANSTSERFDDPAVVLSPDAAATNGTNTPFSTLNWGAIQMRESRLEARKTLLTDEPTLLVHSDRSSVHPSPSHSVASITPQLTGRRASSRSEEMDDLSILSPRALHRKMFPNTPSTNGNHPRRQTSNEEPSAPPTVSRTESLPMPPVHPLTRLSLRSRESRSDIAGALGLSQLVGTPARSPLSTTRDSSLARSRSRTRTDTAHSLEATPIATRASAAHIHTTPPYSLSHISNSMAVFNLATSPPPSHRSPSKKGLHGNTARRHRKGAEKSIVDPYDSSSEEEFTVRPVSYTPPPSGAAIRAIDYEEGDQYVKVDGVNVEIDVPTIASAIRRERRQRRRQHRAEVGSQEEKENLSDEDEDDDDDLQSARSHTRANDQDHTELSLPPVAVPATPPIAGDEKDAASAAPVPSPPPPPPRITNASLIPNGVTTAWTNKVAAAQVERQRVKELMRLHADELAAHMTGKVRQAQASPYQEAVTFGTANPAHHRPASARTHRAHEPTRPSAPRTPATHASSTRAQRKTAPASSIADPSRSSRGTLKPSPPPASRSTISSAGKTASLASTPLHVLNSGATVMAARTAPAARSRSDGERTPAASDSSATPTPKQAAGEPATTTPVDTPTSTHESVSSPIIREATTTSPPHTESLDDTAESACVDSFDTADVVDEGPTTTEPPADTPIDTAAEEYAEEFEAE